MKFETEKELVDYIDMCHLQNTNGRETHDEMFRLGIEAAIEEMIEFKLLTIPFVSLDEQGEATVCQWCAGTGEFCENKEHTDTEYDPIVCEVHCFECDKPKK